MEYTSGPWSYHQVPAYFQQDMHSFDGVDRELAAQSAYIKPTVGACFDARTREQVQRLYSDLSARLKTHVHVQRIAEALAEAARSAQALLRAEALLSAVDDNDDSIHQLLAWVRKMAMRWKRRVAKRDSRGWDRRRAWARTEDDDIDAELSAQAYDMGIVLHLGIVVLEEDPEEIDLLHRVSQRLTPREYCVLILHRIDELSFAAIGNWIGWTEVRVRNLYYYVLKKLKGWMEGEAGRMATS